MIGLLNLHKPVGVSSRAVVDLVGRAARTRRAGHAGTLDPLASGVLLVCVGWATRLVTYLQDRPKTYVARFLLGRRSNTDDTTGEVTLTPDVIPPSQDELSRALRPFVGTISQVPPQFSAVHVGGVRAYQAARQGQAVEIPPRPVEVYRIEVQEYAFPELVLTIECGSGTYIRSIGRDLGDALGCGAVMSALERTAIGEFTRESALTLEELKSPDWSGRLLPPLQAVAHLPRQVCDADTCLAVWQGKKIPVHIQKPQSAREFVLVNPAGELIALANLTEDGQQLHPRQVFCGDPTK